MFQKFILKEVDLLVPVFETDQVTLWFQGVVQVAMLRLHHICPSSKGPQIAGSTSMIAAIGVWVGKTQ